MNPKDLEIFPTPLGGLINSLKECGVDIKEYIPKSQAYLATKENTQVILLIHVSNRDGWWGILREFIKKIEDTELVKNKKVSWGAVLLDKDHRRGYWISQENFKQLENRFLIKEKQQGQYHFKDEDLEKTPEFAPYFVSFNQFQRYTGLE